VPGRPPDDADLAVADTPPPGPDAEAGQLDTAATPTARRGSRGVRIGDALGRYELGDELGEGGMATVFRARDPELRRDVAVKVLFPHLARRPEVVRRFHREARAAAGLEHRNILRVYDVGGSGGGDPDDPPYIVMELVRGRTLLQEIEHRGAMLAEVAACIGALLGDALCAAHAAGIIHRDVKPANVLIAPGGRLLLGDFGVARLETEDSLVTRTGALLGTPAYMSPEQAAGDVATARSDLYSLGATLYQLATGSLPYAGPPAKVMPMIAAGNAVAPVRRHSSCGPDLSRAIERLMAVEAAARPASAAAVALELRALVAASGLGEPDEELAAYFADPDGFLRARVPVVVASLVAAARAAIAEAKLPRAMALADRAGALAPADPAVASLIRAVTEGGHASRRKRALAIAGAAVVLAGGGIALGWQLMRAPPGDATGSAGKPIDPRVELRAAPGADGGSSAAPDAAAIAVLAPADAGAQLAPPGQGSALAPPGPVVAVGVVPTVGSRPLDGGAGVRPPGQRGSAPGNPTGGAPSSISGVPSGSNVAIRPRRDRAVAASGEAPQAGRSRPPSGVVLVPPPVASSEPGSGSRRDSSSATRSDVGAAPDSPGAGDLPPAMATAPAASVAPTAADAATAPASAPPAAAPAGPGRLIVRNDVWCNIWIDATQHGNRRNEPLEAPAGHHTVRCVNPSVGEWTQSVELAPGATQTVTGTLLRPIAVRLDVDATIDGKRHARGEVVQLKPGILEVTAGGKKQFITFRAACTLRDEPELGCYL
jgi:serine/threonine-protein kinase